MSTTGLTVAAVGCGQSSTTTNTGSSTASVTETTSAADNKDTAASSDTSAEESSTVSRKESKKEESSTRAQFDPNTEMQLNVLAVHEIPYEEGKFNKALEPYPTMKVITAFVSADSFFLLSKGSPSIKLTSGESDRTENGNRRFLVDMYSVQKANKTTEGAHLVEIVCDPQLNPSDFCYRFSISSEEYSVPFSDAIASVPENFIDETQDVHIYHLASLDDQIYFAAGYTKSNSGGSLHSTDTGDYHTDYIEKTLNIRRIDTDGTARLDISRFSYEYDEEGLKDVDTTPITVTITEVTPDGTNDRLFSQNIRIHMEYEYEQDSLSKEEREVLSKTRDKMAQYGYLVYNGDNGKVRIHL